MLRRVNAGLLKLHDNRDVLQSLHQLVRRCYRCDGHVDKTAMDVAGGAEWRADGKCPVCWPLREWLKKNFDVELPMLQLQTYPSYEERIHHGDHLHD